MTAATSHRRATSEILAALETGLRGVTWHGQPALDRVEQFTEADLVEAFRRLLISEQRVCLIVAMDEEFNSETKGNKLIVRRVQGRPPRVSLVATDGITPPIWFGQGSDPEILGVVTVGVHHLVD